MQVLGTSGLTASCTSTRSPRAHASAGLDRRHPGSAAEHQFDRKWQMRPRNRIGDSRSDIFADGDHGVVDQAGERRQAPAQDGLPCSGASCLGTGEPNRLPCPAAGMISVVDKPVSGGGRGDLRSSGWFSAELVGIGGLHRVEIARPATGLPFHRLGWRRCDRRWRHLLGLGGSASGLFCDRAWDGRTETSVSSFCARLPTAASGWMRPGWSVVSGADRRSASEDDRERLLSARRGARRSLTANEQQQRQSREDAPGDDVRGMAGPGALEALVAGQPAAVIADHHRPAGRRDVALPAEIAPSRREACSGCAEIRWRGRNPSTWSPAARRPWRRPRRPRRATGRVRRWPRRARHRPGRRWTCPSPRPAGAGHGPGSGTPLPGARRRRRPAERT